MSDDEAELVRLLSEAVPEVAAGSVVIKAVARKRGWRSKLALISDNPRIDAVGVCVGVRGCRIKQVIDQLDGERVDMVRWNDSPETMIRNTLLIGDIGRVILEDAQRRAHVILPDYELSSAVGRNGMNRDLASQICGWEIEIVSE
jgi:transcription termination/antitermination protein NusA